MHGPLQSLAAHLQTACWLKQLPAFQLPPTCCHLRPTWSGSPMDGFLPRVTAPPSSLASVRASNHATPLCSHPGLIQNRTLSPCKRDNSSSLSPSPASYHLLFYYMFVPMQPMLSSTSPAQQLQHKEQFLSPAASPAGDEFPSSIPSLQHAKSGLAATALHVMETPDHAAMRLEGFYNWL